jgi:hypothetical protein
MNRSPRRRLVGTRVIVAILFGAMTTAHGQDTPAPASSEPSQANDISAAAPAQAPPREGDTAAAPASTRVGPEYDQPADEFSGQFDRRYRRSSIMRSVFTPRNVLDPFVALLGDLNLSPTFNLTVEQKQKIADLRATHARFVDLWRRTNAADLADLQFELRELSGFGAFRGGFTNGPVGDGGEDASRDSDKRRALFDTIRQFVASAPSGETQVQAIRDLLTPSQLEQLNARWLQSQVDAEQRRASEWFENASGGFGAAPGVVDEPQRSDAESRTDRGN